MSESTWRPQGDGPHSTLAANVLDPGVKADGAMNAGQGVGGARPEKQKEEGAEHIKKNAEGLSEGSGVSGGQASATGLGNSASGYGSSGSSVPSYGREGVVPASNPGAEDSTGGIGSGAGGQDSQGIVGTVKNYLGLGGTSGSSEPMEARNVDDYRSGTLSDRGEAAGLGAGALGGAGVAGAGLSQYDSSTRGSSYPDSSAPGSTYQDSSRSGSTFQNSPATQKGSTTMGSAPERETHGGSGAPRPKDSDVTTGAPPTESADPTTADTADRSASKDDKGEGGDKPKKNVSDKEAAVRENTDSIPTAGGEKLGQKHWGESKKVADIPPKRESEGANVSSAEGQSDSTTQANTAKNTGGGSNPHDSSSGHDGEKKEGLADKLKHSLHIGHK